MGLLDGRVSIVTGGGSLYAYGRDSPQINSVQLLFIQQHFQNRMKLLCAASVIIN